jgi:hypothetical protein
MDRSKKDEMKEDPWMQGFACALATLNRLYDHPGLVEGTLVGSGITIAMLKRAGVEDYDLVELKKCVRKK